MFLKELMLLIVFGGGKLTIDFQLDIKEKSKLIEILLIVGALLVALQLPKILIWIFMLFVIFAIVYFISIQHHHKESIILNIIAFFTSLCFSGIVAYLLAFSVGMASENRYGIFPQIVALVYILTLTAILTNALKIGKFFRYDRKEPSIKKKSKNTSTWDGDPAFVSTK